MYVVQESSSILKISRILFEYFEVYILAYFVYPMFREFIFLTLCNIVNEINIKLGPSQILLSRETRENV